MKWRAGILYRPELGETKYHAVFDENDRIIAATGLVGCECEPESIEHAKLIAAAPELLEALTLLVEPCPPDFAIEWAKEIIKKAKGETPWQKS